MEIESSLPPPPLHPLLPTTTCDLHPGVPVIGFCASCLRERLAGLDACAAADAPPKSTSSSIKSIFFRSSAAAGCGGTGPPHHSSSNNLHSSSFRRPEFRRCKSFSASRGPTATTAVEPQRKSCDVRGRNTLWSLFHQDDSDRAAGSASGGGDGDEITLEPITVPDSDEIMAFSDAANAFGISGEMEEDKEEAAAETKPMKDHIDLESQVKKPPPKDLKEIAGSFWLVASVFSKKLRNWRRKQKLKKKSAMPPEKAGSSSRRFCQTQSEFSVNAFGRRSCDIDPRFSLDAQLSFDDPRLSWDAPRASWDGYLIGGGRSMLPRLPQMIAVVEDPPAAAVQRFDGEIPVEEDIEIPGGSLQTRDYYDRGSRRQSLDHESNSTMKQSFEIGDPNRSAVTEQLVSFHGSKQERDSREWSSNSLRDECFESLDSGFRDLKQNARPLKMSRRWSKSWNIWGFIHRRGGRNRANGVDRSFSETWSELQSKAYNDRLFRSNSSLSSRSLFLGNAGLGSMRMNGMENNGIRKEKFVLERNRSARFSPIHFDNGLLKFYLPPVKSCGQKRGGWGKSKCSSSPHSFTGSIPSLY